MPQNKPIETTFAELKLDEMFVESYGGTFGNEIKLKLDYDHFYFLGYPKTESYKIDPLTIVYKVKI